MWQEPQEGRPGGWAVFCHMTEAQPLPVLHHIPRAVWMGRSALWTGLRICLCLQLRVVWCV